MADLLVARKHARGLIRLLKEYADKLRELAAEYERRQNFNQTQSTHYSVGDLIVRAQSIRPALLNVTREASGMAEQGDVADLDRLELRLRLAEVEGLLKSLEMK